MQRERQHGAEADLRFAGDISSRAILFGEAQARFILSTPSAAKVLEIAGVHGVPARQIGMVTSPDSGLRITTHDSLLVAGVDALSDAYHGAIPAIMSRAALAADDAPEPILAGV